MRLVLIIKKDTRGDDTVTTTLPDREIADRLGQLDIRYTAGRRLVVAALTATQGPQTAAQLHANIGQDVPLSSLYRTLAVLEEAGVVSRHFGAEGVMRYELAEWLKGHHHHLVCVDCGSVEDIELTRDQERLVHRVVDDIGEAAAFQTMSHTLEIEGRCARCT